MGKQSIISTTAIAGALLGLTFLLRQSDLSALAFSEKEPFVGPSESRLWVLRLRPGDDLVDSILEFSRRHSIEAGGIVTCVGSLDQARLRFANQPVYQVLEERGRKFEIISLTGTFSTTEYHFHLALANEQGDVIGGHAGSGNRVFTTAELLIVEGINWSFRREPDPTTTFRELVPIQRNATALDGSP